MELKSQQVTATPEEVFNQAMRFVKENQLDQALPLFKNILNTLPNHANTHQWLSFIATQKQDYITALKHINRAIDSAPARPDFLYNRAMLYIQIHRSSAAIRDLNALIVLDEKYYPAYRALGDFYHQLEDYQKSIEIYERGLKIVQTDVEVWDHLGIAHKKLRHYDKALVCFEQSCKLNSNRSEVYTEIGMLTKDNEAALAAFKKSLLLNPNNDDVAAKVLYTQAILCDWTNRDELLKRAEKSARESTQAPSKICFNSFEALAYPWPSDLLLEIAIKENAYVKRSIQADKLKTKFRYNTKNKNRLRIAYISASFRNFPTGHLTHKMYACHDRNDFEIFAYSYSGEDDSFYRQCISEGVDHFVDITDFSIKEAAERIHNDGIDILIDLMGTTTLSRLEINALRPAPINVRYLGSPLTSGTDFFDYFISDAYLTPLEKSQHFTESLVLMPHTYQVTSEHSIAKPKSREDYGLPKDGLVFCAFNNNYKIEPEIFSIWMHILKGNPKNVLWLMQTGVSLENLRAQALQQGIDPQRLISAPRLPKDQHLARLSHADIFLDTPIYNAHTTASDVLYAGVPLLTISGETFQSRVAGSILRAIDLQDLIMQNADEYLAYALKLSAKPEEIKRLKQRIAIQQNTTPLFDTKRFVKNLENAYKIMWQQLQNGDRQHIIVQE